eukprot:TRINITY_DN27954_c0_g1_i1.p1 TRINITY_DN27954_c0_g1~~TRINITY_DN27954_c0_g1_i1.p1  ORF type:complete len:226 (+),score=25.82 TRINITY_DN27954_c0_g1_i1:72-680(+)
MHQLLRGATQQSIPSKTPLCSRLIFVAIGIVCMMLVFALKGEGGCSNGAGVQTVLPVRHAVAFAIRNPKDQNMVLTVTRPGDDSSLPGIIGLPAGYVHETESHEDAVRKRGIEKLGVDVKPVKFIGRGRTVRQTYVLEMEEYEAVLVDPEQVPVVPQTPSVGTQYISWEWRAPTALIPAADRGSLCSRIFLSSTGVSSYSLT